MLNGRRVTCNNCGRVHFPVTKAWAKSEVEKFCQFWDESERATRECYWNEKYDGPLPEKYPPKKLWNEYNFCERCGESYKNFRDSKPGDCPDGCTIGPILDRHELDPGGISF